MLRETLKNSAVLTGIVKALRLWPGDWQRFRDHRRRGAIFREYFAANPNPRLNVGSGPNQFPGWLNTDYYPRARAIAFLDATKPLPFPDRTFTHVFSEHMIEHIPFNAARLFLRESFRVLRPGGRVRIATPDLRLIVSIFAEPPSPAAAKYINFCSEAFMTDLIPNFDFARFGHRAPFVLNQFYWRHRHLAPFDEAILRICMEEAGFTDIQRYIPGQSDTEEFKGLESHGKLVGDDINNFETLILEGTRP